MQRKIDVARIARIWRGQVAPERADAYEAYLLEAGIPPIERTALAVQVLREDRQDRSEFATVSYWQDIEAMARFAGPDPVQIHHLPRDREFLLQLPESVQILRILHQKLALGF